VTPSQWYCAGPSRRERPPRRWRRRGLVLAALAESLAATSLAAQQPRDTIVLDEVVVTATRLPLPRAAVASAVTVLTGDELRSRGITNLLDALRQVPAAAIVQGGSFGTVASLFLRGGESDYVKVLVDGVTVNEPGGAFDFAHLAVDNVDRIEIVRGPASVVYGSDAMAGVVQVITRRGEGPPRWLLAAGGGTYGSSQLRADVAGGSENAGFSASASRFRSHGTYAFNSGYRRTDLSGQLRAGAGARSGARLTFRLDDHVTRFPTDGAGIPVDRNQYTTGRQSALGLEGRHLLSSRLELLLLLGSSVADAGYDDRADALADTLGSFAFVSRGRITRRSGDLRAVARLAPGTTLTVGGSFERQAARSRDSSDSQWGRSTDSLVASRRGGAAYAQLVADRGGRVALNLGARLDRNQRFGSFGTYRAGISWRLAPLARVRAAVGSALKEPTFFENFASGWVVGNRDLRPEKSRSWEVGCDAQLGAGRGGAALAATLFAQRFTDLIQYTSAPPVPGAPNYVNVAVARASGIEAEGSLALGAGLTARGHHTYLSSAAVDAAGSASGGDRPLLRRPTHAGGVSFAWAARRAALSVAAEYVGRREDTDYGAAGGAVRVRMPAYLRVDAAATLPLLGRRSGAAIEASLRVENLLGASYEEVRGFPARRRTVFVSLSAEGGFR